MYLGMSVGGPQTFTWAPQFLQAEDIAQCYPGMEDIPKDSNFFPIQVTDPALAWNRHPEGPASDARVCRPLH